MTRQTDDIDIDESDLDDLFESLPSPANLTSGENARRAYAQELASIAARDPWQARRRILYIHVTTCESCGTRWEMPNHRVLTEYEHEDGRRKHATTADQNPNLPLEQERLPDGTSEICQFCMTQGSNPEDGE